MLFLRSTFFRHGLLGLLSLRAWLFLLSTWSCSAAMAIPADSSRLTRYEQAVASYLAGDLLTALPPLKASYREAVAANDPETALGASMYLAHGPALLGQAEEAWAAYDSLEVRRLRWRPHSNHWKARSVYIKGQIHSLLSESLAAIEEAQRAWQLAQQADSVDHALMGGIAHTLGVEYSQLGDRLSALQWLRRAISHEEATAPPNYYQLNLLYFATAQTLGELGDLTHAILYLDQCVRLIRQQPSVPDRFFPGTLILRGNLAVSGGDYEAAHRAYQEALRLFQQQGNAFFASNSVHALNGLGICYQQMHQDSAAFRCYQQALTQALRTPATTPARSIPNIMINLAKGHRDLGRLEAGRDALHRILRFLDQELNVSWYYVARATVMKEFARNYLAEEQLDAALHHCQLALHIYGTGVDSSDRDSEPTRLPLNLGWSLPEILSVKAEIYARKHQLEGDPRALQQARRMIYLADSAIALIQRHLSEPQDKHVLVQKMVRFYELGIELALKAGDTSGAFVLAERASSRLFRLNLQGSRFEASTEAPPEWLAQEKSLRLQRYHWQQQLARLSAHQTSAKDSLQALLFAQQPRYTRLREQLAETAPQYHRLRYQESRVDLATIQQDLRQQDSWCLRYFWGEKRLYLFALDGHTLECAVYSLDEISPLLDGVLDHLCNEARVAESGYQAATFHAFVDTARQLYQVLLGPWSQRALPPSLRIVPDGPLAYLPFEILLARQVSPRAEVNYAALPYLFRRCGLYYTYTAVPLAAPDRSSARNRYLGIAPRYQGMATTYSARDLDLSHLAPLRGNIPEVKQVAQLFDGTAWIGDQATEARFKALATQARVLHLSTHAVFDDRNPMYSGLLLDWGQAQYTYGDSTHDDGILYAYELYGLSLRAELVVLSACQTGSGVYQRGEGVASLARAFHYAGCPSVVMSLWPVDDLATKDLMIDFFSALQSGLAKDEALRQARDSFLAKQPKQHPHYWAGFVLMGNQAPLDHATHWGWWLAAGILLAALLLLLWCRRSQGPVG